MPWGVFFRGSIQYGSSLFRLSRFTFNDLKGKGFIMREQTRSGMMRKLCILITAALIAMTAVVSVSAAQKHSTTLYGQSYSYVYDYNYYTTKVHPELAGKSDFVVLKYFVSNGMPKQEKGIASFDPKSYRLGNQDLRVAFGMDYPSYYLHYQNYGHGELSRRGTTTGVTKLQNPVTVYEGFDYSKVYDYNYYIKKHPSVGKMYPNDDVSVLRHFVTIGSDRQYQAIENFDVKSYRYGNADLRVKFRLNYLKYYRHYCKYGWKYAARRRTATGIRTFKNIITTYKGVDYSEIYDFKYYVSHNAIASQFKDDDAGAIQNFIKRGLLMGLTAKSGITSGNPKYIKVLLSLYPNALKNEYIKANQYASATKYLILLNQGEHTVYIFKGKQYNWEKIATYPCCVGAVSTPTPVGVFSIGSRGTYFVTHSGNAKCWYFTQIYYSILFHSQIYDLQNAPVRLLDGRMGVSCSLGCVRLHLSNALWIYNNIPRGTKVVVYNRPW